MDTDRPAIAEIYGQAYLWVEQCGGCPGRTELIYQIEDGASYTEDAAGYFGGLASWFPPDLVARERVRGRVLDIGCGVGRHALELSRAGHEVVGLEPSMNAVSVARRRGVDARVGSLSDPPGDLGTFDTFLLLGANLALLTTYPRPDLALKRLADMAKPGARILGSDIRLPAAPPTSHLRVRARHGGESTGWSAWEGGQPYLPPEGLGDFLHGSAWCLEELLFPPEQTGDGYLACLRLTGPARTTSWDNDEY